MNEIQCIGIITLYLWTPKYFEAIAAWQQKRNGWLPDTEHMAFAPSTKIVLADVYRQSGTVGTGHYNG